MGWRRIQVRVVPPNLSDEAARKSAELLGGEQLKVFELTAGKRFAVLRGYAEMLPREAVERLESFAKNYALAIVVVPPGMDFEIYEQLDGTDDELPASKESV